MHPVRAGEEISIYYGERPNSHLLVFQGFVAERHCADVLVVPFSVPNDDPLFKMKKLFLSRRNADTNLVGSFSSCWYCSSSFCS